MEKVTCLSTESLLSSCVSGPYSLLSERSLHSFVCRPLAWNKEKTFSKLHLAQRSNLQKLISRKVCKCSSIIYFSVHNTLQILSRQIALVILFEVNLRRVLLFWMIGNSTVLCPYTEIIFNWNRVDGRTMFQLFFASSEKYHLITTSYRIIFWFSQVRDSPEEYQFILCLDVMTWFVSSSEIDTKSFHFSTFTDWYCNKKRRRDEENWDCIWYVCVNIILLHSRKVLLKHEMPQICVQK